MAGRLRRIAELEAENLRLEAELEKAGQLVIDGLAVIAEKDSRFHELSHKYGFIYDENQRLKARRSNAEN